MRIPPLLRTILVLTGGVSAALYGLAATVPEESAEEWAASSPLATRGCPALDRHVAFWRKQLGIPAWEIVVECGLPLAELRDHLGLAWTDPERRKARIWVREGLTWTWQHRVVVHELVHVGIAAGRWKVPAGRIEEDYVQELEEAIVSGGTA